MGFVAGIDGLGRSLLLVPPPGRYSDVKPHHLLVLYGMYRLLANSSFFAARVRPMLRAASTGILTALSDVAERIGVPLVHSGYVPDFVVRWGIRLQLRAHLAELSSASCEEQLSHKMDVVDSLTHMPVAVETDAANRQHYEVPAKFYDLCLVRSVPVLEGENGMRR